MRVANNQSTGGKQRFPPTDSLLSDASAFIGGGLFAVIFVRWLTASLAITRIELFLLFALFVLVPLGFSLVRWPTNHRVGRVLTKLVLVGQFPAAVLALIGFAYPATSHLRLGLLIPWAVLTTCVGLLGLLRLREHGKADLTIHAIDAAFLYLPVAGLFLLLHARDITFHFGAEIVLLTAVHFHYAGFVLPLVVGLVGEFRATSVNQPRVPDTCYTFGTIGVILGIGLIALAITISPWLELPAVVVFTAAVVAVVAVLLVDIVPSAGLVSGGLLAISSLSILVTMGFALAYAYTVFPATGTLVTIPTMIQWHGTINAVGFALSGLVAFRLHVRS